MKDEDMIKILNKLVNGQADIKLDIAVMRNDMDKVKVDLCEHKEGVIQNRGEISKNKHFVSQLIGAGKLLTLIALVIGIVSKIQGAW